MPIRAAKIAMVAAIALFASLVTFGNLTDYHTNFLFVQHVLSMDTIFRSPTSATARSPIRRCIAPPMRSSSRPKARSRCCAGSAHSSSPAMSAPTPRAFNRAKAIAVIGLTLGFLLWQVGFMTIGGEWFGMWQSQQWNGVPSAYRFVMVIAAVLIFLALPDT